jgi:hypothetical protein
MKLFSFYNKYRNFIKTANIYYTILNIKKKLHDVVVVVVVVVVVEMKTVIKEAVIRKKGFEDFI